MRGMPVYIYIYIHTYLSSHSATVRANVCCTPSAYKDQLLAIMHKLQLNSYIYRLAGQFSLNVTCLVGYLLHNHKIHKIWVCSLFCPWFCHVRGVWR
ncbi:hypothetical protein FKM82_008691 [Ascaphus truei]